MAQPDTARGTKLHVLQGDGGGPEVFTAYCGLNARTITFRSQTNDVYVPDCDNPEDPAWRSIIKSGRAVTVTGSGVLDTTTALPKYQAAYDSADASNYQIELDVPLAKGGGHWAGAFQLTEFSITGNDNDLTNVSITLESEGPVTWVPALV